MKFSTQCASTHTNLQSSAVTWLIQTRATSFSQLRNQASDRTLWFTEWCLYSRVLCLLCLDQNCVWGSTINFDWCQTSLSTDEKKQTRWVGLPHMYSWDVCITSLNCLLGTSAVKSHDYWDTAMSCRGNLQTHSALATNEDTDTICKHHADRSH